MSGESVGSRYLARTFCVSWPNYRVRRGRQETQGCTVNCKSNNDMPAMYNVPNILPVILILARPSRRPVVLLIYTVIDDDGTTRTDRGTTCLEIESSSARSKWNNIFLCLLAGTRISRLRAYCFTCFLPLSYCSLKTYYFRWVGGWLSSDTFFSYHGTGSSIVFRIHVITK